MRVLVILAGVVLSLVALTAQVSIPPGASTLTIQSPAPGAVQRGQVTVVVLVTGNPATVTASLTRNANEGPLVVPLFKSDTTAAGATWRGVYPLDNVTTTSTWTLKVTDGTNLAGVSFPVEPMPSPPSPIEPTHAGLMAVIAANQIELLRSLHALAATIAPVPAPQGTACVLVSATTVYANGHYKFTMDCPPVFGSKMPTKPETVYVLGAAGSSAVVK